MFADNTNLFYSHKNIRQLFTKVNEELEKIGDWFKANKLSLNNTRTKYMLFHKKSIRDDLCLCGHIISIKIKSREVSC